jgi:Smr domain-containing protein
MEGVTTYFFPVSSIKCCDMEGDSESNWFEYIKGVKPLQGKEKVLKDRSVVKNISSSHGKEMITRLNFSNEGGNWSSVDRRAIRKRKRVEAVLDLHGLSFEQALGKVLSFITRSYRDQLSHMIIITGKGKEGSNSLQREVPIWLRSNELRPMISQVQHAQENGGGKGVLHVFLKKQRS